MLILPSSIHAALDSLTTSLLHSCKDPQGRHLAPVLSRFTLALQPQLSSNAIHPWLSVAYERQHASPAMPGLSLSSPWFLMACSRPICFSLLQTPVSAMPSLLPPGTIVCIPCCRVNAGGSQSQGIPSSPHFCSTLFASLLQPGLQPVIALYTCLPIGRQPPEGRNTGLFIAESPAQQRAQHIVGAQLVSVELNFLRTHGIDSIWKQHCICRIDSCLPQGPVMIQFTSSLASLF